MQELTNEGYATSFFLFCFIWQMKQSQQIMKIRCQTNHLVSSEKKKLAIQLKKIWKRASILLNRMNSHISQVQIVEWINLNLANRQILHKTYLQRKGTSTHQLSRLLSFASFSYFWMVRSSTWPLKNNICPPAVDLPASGTMKQRK